MKNIVLVVIVISFSVIVAAQRKHAEDDPQVTHDIVQRAFNEVSVGTYTSWSEKYLARLGDSAAPEIMKRVSSPDATKKDIATALELVRMSFANPRFILHDENKHRRTASRSSTTWKRTARTKT